MKHECRGLQTEEIVQQMDNHNTIKDPYIEEEQTTQWPKEKVQKDKQRSTKHTYKTSGSRRVNLVTNPVISRE